MEKIKKILACVDLSDYSKMTLDYSISLSREFKSEIVIFSVINVRDISAVETASHFYPEQINVDDYVRRAKEVRHQQIQELLDEHYSEDLTRITIAVGVGVPFEVILETVESEQIDLVIMGNKGRGNVIGTRFGSTAEKVFRHSPVHVLSVRDRSHFKRHR
ncbi:MAG: universal stress protein [Desulfocapsaceae bacterium]|jgi:nucleotide-binding universal stress UspA family protein|nr:universal stress protein [Desulfocapsaceae bacterium]